MPGRAGLREALQAVPGSFRPGGSSCRSGGPFADPEGLLQVRGSFAGPGGSPAGLGRDFIVFRYSYM